MCMARLGRAESEYAGYHRALLLEQITGKGYTVGHTIWNVFMCVQIVAALDIKWINGFSSLCESVMYLARAPIPYGKRKRLCLFLILLFIMYTINGEKKHP